MKEFIYKIEDEELDISKVFIGWIRHEGHELVRCKDCKHYDKEHEVCCVYLSYRLAKNEDDFCSDAERKEEC